MTTPVSSSGPGLPDIPLGLRQALEAGECVLFIGAGIGRHLMRANVPAPDGPALARELATAFKIDAGGSTNLAKVSQVCRNTKGTPRA